MKLPDLSLRPGGVGALSLHLWAGMAAPGREGGLPAAGAGLAAHAGSSCRGSLYVSLYVQSSNFPFFCYSGIRPKLCKFHIDD